MTQNTLVTPSIEIGVELTAQELGSLLGRMTEKIDKPCRQCGKVMESVTVRREFCGAACRQKNWLRRLYALKPGEEMEHFTRPRRIEQQRTAVQA